MSYVEILEVDFLIQVSIVQNTFLPILHLQCLVYMRHCYKNCKNYQTS